MLKAKKLNSISRFAFKTLLLIALFSFMGLVKPQKAAAADNCQAISAASPGVGAQVSLVLIYPDNTRKFSQDFKFSVASYNPHPTATRSAYDYGDLPSGAGTVHIDVGDNIPAFSFQGKLNEAVTDKDRNHSGSATFNANSTTMRECSAVQFLTASTPGYSYMFDDFWKTGWSNLNCLHGAWGQSGVIPDHSAGFDFTLDTNSIGDAGFGYSPDLSQSKLTYYRYGPNGPTLFEHFNNQSLVVTFFVHLKTPEDKTPTVRAESNCTGIRLFDVEDANQPSKNLPFDVYKVPHPPNGIIYSGTADGTNNDAQINLRNVVPPGTEVDIGVYNYDWQDQNDNSKAGWVNITWNPDTTNCPNYEIKDVPVITLKRGGVADTENPNTADFSDPFTARNYFDNSAITVKDVDIQCTYKIDKADGSTIPGWPKASTGAPAKGTNTDANLANTYKCEDLGVALPAGLVAGDQICITRSINPNTGRVDINGNRVTPPAETSFGPADFCEPITNRPYFSAYGGDVVAGAGFGSCSLDTNANIKGWTRSGVGAGVQLAAMALADSVDNEFLTKQMGGANNSLWFANDPGIGAFGTLPCVRDFFAEKPAAANVTPPATGEVDVATLASGTKHFVDPDATSPLTVITASAVLGLNTKVELYVDGDVYIRDNISFNTAATSRASLPYFKLVVSGNIYINSGIDRLDGVYIAQPPTTDVNRGVVYTCANVASGTASPVANGSLFNDCGTQLAVNGSLIARQIRLMRTFGSLRDANNSQNPYGAVAACGKPVCSGEVINYSPDAILGDFVDTSAPIPVKSADFITTLPPIL